MNCEQREVATLLGFDDLGIAISDPARLAFEYCAGVPRPPTFVPPMLAWDCPVCGQTVVDQGLPTARPNASAGTARVRRLDRRCHSMERQDRKGATDEQTARGSRTPNLAAASGSAAHIARRGVAG